MQLFNTVCLYKNNTTILYGQYTTKFERVFSDAKIVSLVFCNTRRQFYLVFVGKPLKIMLGFRYKNLPDSTNTLMLTFPFEHCDLQLTPSSAIICTALLK